jgi:feruloyl esterase
VASFQGACAAREPGIHTAGAVVMGSGLAALRRPGTTREHGGKLIMYHGWADPLIPSQSSINCLNALVASGRDGDDDAVHDDDGVRKAGSERGTNPALQRTQSFARLFMVPGMFHCAGGPWPNVFDALTPLVTWV